MRVILTVAVGALFAVLLHCGKAQVCIPGTQLTCVCAGVGPGTQTCNQAGTEFGACVCTAPSFPQKAENPKQATASGPVVGAECFDDNECVGGEHCNKAFRKCEVICTSKDQCSTGWRCDKEGFCTNEPECTSHGQCGPDRVCKLRVCEAPGVCSSENDCPFDYECFQNKCAKKSE